LRELITELAPAPPPDAPGREKQPEWGALETPDAREAHVRQMQSTRRQLAEVEQLLQRLGRKPEAPVRNEAGASTEMVAPPASPAPPQPAELAAPAPRSAGVQQVPAPTPTRPAHPSRDSGGRQASSLRRPQVHAPRPKGVGAAPGPSFGQQRRWQILSSALAAVAAFVGMFLYLHHAQQTPIMPELLAPLPAFTVLHPDADSTALPVETLADSAASEHAAASEAEGPRTAALQLSESGAEASDGSY